MKVKQSLLVTVEIDGTEVDLVPITTKKIKYAGGIGFYVLPYFVEDSGDE